MECACRNNRSAVCKAGGGDIQMLMRIKSSQQPRCREELLPAGYAQHFDMTRREFIMLPSRWRNPNKAARELSRAAFGMNCRCVPGSFITLAASE
jgi:hypothetical protein